MTPTVTITTGKCLFLASFTNYYYYYRTSAYANTCMVVMDHTFLFSFTPVFTPNSSRCLTHLWTGITFSIYHLPCTLVTILPPHHLMVTMQPDPEPSSSAMSYL